MNDLSMALAQRLKELRKSKGLTYAGLSEALKTEYGIHISKESLSNYEVSTAIPHSKSGKNEGMNVKYLRCLADFYGVSTDYLLGRSEVQSPDVTIQGVVDYTGLSENAVGKLHSLAEDDILSIFPGANAHRLEALNTLLTTDSGRWILLYIYNYLLADFDAFTIDRQEDGGEITTLTGMCAGLRNTETGKNVDAIWVRDISALYLSRIQEALTELRVKIQPDAITIEYGDEDGGANNGKHTKDN